MYNLAETAEHYHTLLNIRTFADLEVISVHKLRELYLRDYRVAQTPTAYSSQYFDY